MIPMRLLEPDEDIQRLIEAKKKGQHKCLSGRFVNCYTLTCRNDLCRRIEDAIHFRDHSNTRTDERSYYNGLLRVLRRKLREVEKELSKKELTEGFRGSSEQRLQRRNVSINHRILKLSGIL